MCKKPLIYAWAALIVSCGQGEQISFSESPKPKIASSDAQASLTQTWSTGTPSTQELSIETGFGLVTHRFELEQAPRVVENMEQVYRPIKTVTAFQGNGGDNNTETLLLSRAGIIDILVVVDDSSSMSGYRQKLAQNFQYLIASIADSDWRIGVVTTSSSCLKEYDGVPMLTRDIYEEDPSKAQTIFAGMVTSGSGGPTEYGIEMAADGLLGKCKSTTSAWLRSSSEVGVVIVTDEKNCGSSPTEGCSGEARELSTYLTDQFSTNPTVSGLLLLADPPAGSGSECQDSGYYEADVDITPQNYIDLINATGGSYADVCTADYQQFFESFSQQMNNQKKIQYTLNYAPIGLPTVTVDGVPSLNFNVTGSILEMTSIDPNATNIGITYQHTTQALTDTFSTFNPVEVSTLTVRVNGTEVDSNDYEYKSNNQTLVFDTTPPANAQVDLIFRVLMSVKTSFPYNEEFVENEFDVFVNGEEVQNYTIDTTNFQVDFNSAPPDGADIKFSYGRSSDKTKRYPIVGAPSDQLENFRVIDESTNQEIPTTINSSGQLVFTDGEIYNGRKVRAEYNVQFSDEQRKFSLPTSHRILPESLIVETGDSGTNCSSQITDHSINLDCSDEDFETLKVKYTEIENYTNSFTLDFDYAGPVKWNVFVNGQAFDRYHLIDKTVVILKKDLVAGAKVQISVQPINGDAIF